METDSAMHAAYCGPARGFLICYCECPACRTGDRCTCPGCGAWQHRPTTKEEPCSTSKRTAVR